MKGMAIMIKVNPMVVHYIDWDILLKCKHMNATEEECLKSIWAEEYGNPIKDYNTKGMIRIMGQVIEELVPEKQRAYLLDRLLRVGWIDEDTLLHELYIYLMELQVRERVPINRHKDLYIIECKGKYHTIAQYDELKEDSVDAYNAKLKAKYGDKISTGIKTRVVEGKTYYYYTTKGCGDSDLITTVKRAYESANEYLGHIGEIY